MSTSNSYKKSNLTIQAEEDEDHEESQGTNSQPSPSIAEYPPKESIASILKKNKDFAEKKSRPVPQSPEKNQAAHMEAPLLTANRESLAQEIPAERNSVVPNNYFGPLTTEVEDDEMSEFVALKSDTTHSHILSSSPKKRSTTIGNAFGAVSSTPYSSHINLNPFVQLQKSASVTDINQDNADAGSNASINDSAHNSSHVKMNNINCLDAKSKNSRLEDSTSPQEPPNDQKCDCSVYLEESAIVEGLLPYLDVVDVLELRLVAGIYKQKKLSKVIKMRIYHDVQIGFSRPQQKRFWRHFVNFERIKLKCGFTFTSSFVKSSPYVREIKKDLDRTLQEDAFFQSDEGKNYLYRVLVAISNTTPEVGYIQGLNSIVGTLLLYLKEEDTYWMTRYLLEIRGIKYLICLKFPLVDLWNYELKVFMKEYIPEVYNHIIDNEMTIEYYSTPWFLTLFTYYFQTPVVMKIWNLYLLRGDVFFIQLSLAIFEFYKKDIVTRDIDELSEFLKRTLKDLFIEENLLDMALNGFEVTHRLYDQLKKYYQDSAPLNLELARNEKNKANFVLKPEPVDSVHSSKNHLEQPSVSELKKQGSVEFDQASSLQNTEGAEKTSPAEGHNHANPNLDDSDFSPIRTEKQAGELENTNPSGGKRLTKVLKTVTDGFARFGKFFSRKSAPSKERSFTEGMIKPTPEESKQKSEPQRPLVSTRVLDEENSNRYLNLETLQHQAELHSQKHEDSDVSFMSNGPHRNNGTKFFTERPSQKELDSPSPVIRKRQNGSPSQVHDPFSEKYGNSGDSEQSIEYSIDGHESSEENIPSSESPKKFMDKLILPTTDGWMDSRMQKPPGASGDNEHEQWERTSVSERKPSIETGLRNSESKQRIRSHSINDSPHMENSLALSIGLRRSRSTPRSGHNKSPASSKTIEGEGRYLEDGIKEDIMSHTQIFTPRDSTNKTPMLFNFSLLPLRESVAESENHDLDYDADFSEHKPNAPN